MQLPRRAYGRDKRVSGHQGPILIITWLNLVLSYQSMMIYNILVRTYEMCSPSEAWLCVMQERHKLLYEEQKKKAKK